MKTLTEIKNKIAKDDGFEDWEDLLCNGLPDYIRICIDQVAELYAEAYHKSKLAEVTDESWTFKMKDWDVFHEEYKDVCSETLLKKIWYFANERWKEGYNQGKFNPDFD